MKSTITKRLLVDLLAVSMFSSTFTAVPSVSAEELSGELVSAEAPAANDPVQSGEIGGEADAPAEFGDPGGSFEEPGAPADIAEEPGYPFAEEPLDMPEEGAPLEEAQPLPSLEDFPEEAMPWEDLGELTEEPDLVADELRDELVPEVIPGDELSEAAEAETDLTESPDEENPLDEDKDPIEEMTEIIEKTIAENEDEGIYIALNNTFEALAENTDDLVDPENGVNKVDGNEVVKITYDALDAHFDNTPQELYGAIGAAAARADDKGIINEMNETGALKDLAIKTKNSVFSWKTTKKYCQTSYDSVLVALGESCKEAKLIIPFLKLIGMDIFDDGADTGDEMAALKEQINQILQILDNTRQELRDHMYNVTSMSDIGTEMCSIVSKCETIRTRIENIRRNGGLSEEEKTTEIANLYTFSEFAALESALNGGANCFYANNNTIFNNRNIFDAAYATACETVMFSQEALKVSAPYLLEQLAIFEEAYSVVSTVYDEYEKVFGPESLQASRQLQAARLYGTDLDGNVIGGSVHELMANYFKRDKYIFVNKNSSTNIPVSPRILVKRDINRYLLNNLKSYKSYCNTPDFMSNMPLSAAQVNNLAAYCAEKKVTIFDFLFNQMMFEPDALTPAELSKKELAVQPFECDWLARPRKFYPKGRIVTGTIYLLTGAQTVQKYRPHTGTAWVTYDVTKAATVGAGNETVTFDKRDINSYGEMYDRDETYNNTLMFFMPR